MNYITPEQIKEYVSKNPTGIAGNSKELSEMVNYFAQMPVKECADFVYYKAEKAMSQEIVYVGDDLLKHFGVEE